MDAGQQETSAARNKNQQQILRQRLQTYPAASTASAASRSLPQPLIPELASRNQSKSNGNESPDSASLGSDEIPSGYNSGEQYDTISTGYMSGEAYELPETRMDLHREPALDVIEECIQPLNNADSDENIFRMPTSMGTPDVNPSVFIQMDQDEVDLSSTSSGAEDKVTNEANSASSPIYGKKLRKKPLTFSVPIETCPLSKDDEHEIYGESSDNGMGDAPTGGYRAVPSDTDTSAVDSDPNAMDGRHKRLGRKRKNFKNHDEAWFMAHDTKKWTVIRFICFWSSILCMLAATVLAVVLIIMMPHKCDPNTEWYQGKVILDVNPTGKDIQKWMNNDLDFGTFKDTGVSTLHLKHELESTSSFLSKYEESQATELIDLVHGHNMSLIVQVPIIGTKNGTILDLDLQHDVDKAIEFWMSQGADGIFLDGLEHFRPDKFLAQQISYWHSLLDRYGTSLKTKILMTSYKFAKKLSDNEHIPEEARDQALQLISLLDAHLELDQDLDIDRMEQDMLDITQWDTIQSRPWINWNLKTTLPLSNAATALQMLLPGTINLVDTHQITPDPAAFKNMTNLRALAVPIYMNGNYKRCDCPEGTTKEVNYALNQPLADTIQLERFYNRRHRYVLVANFGNQMANLAPVGKIYAGGELVLDTSQSLPLEVTTKFSAINLQPKEAIVIKLPK